MSVTLASTAPAVAQPHALDPRTRLLLQGSIIPTLLRLAWPNVLVMLAQASTGLIETWWVSHLGTDALAGMALVFPVFMMMQMLSAGAMGGGISSAIARALGGGRRADADALVLHAIIINLLLGLTFSVLVLAFGPSLYGALGGEGESLEAALLYSNVVFAGVGLVWLMNGLASVIRGTGNMLVPSLATCIGVVVLVPLAPADLRRRTDPRARDRRGRDCGHPHHRADSGGAGLVHRVRPQPGPAALCTAPYDPVQRYPAGGRCRLDQHAADHLDGRASHRPGGCRRRAGRHCWLRHRRAPGSTF